MGSFRGQHILPSKTRFFYVFKHQLAIFIKCFITPLGISDHSMVKCLISKNNIKRRRAQWHFNTTLLEDFLWSPLFISGPFSKSEMADFSSLQQWCDIVKSLISVFCQQYTFKVTREMVRSLKALEIGYVEPQPLEYTGNQGHIEALKNKQILMNAICARCLEWRKR